MADLLPPPRCERSKYTHTGAARTPGRLTATNTTVSHDERPPMTPRPTPSKKRQDEAARAAVKVVMDLRRARVGLAIEKKAAEVGAKLHPRQAVKIAEAALDTIGVEHVERCLFESQREAAALRQEKRDVMLSSVANHVIEPGTTIGGTSIAKLHELATQRCADLRIALEAIVNEWNDPHTIPSRRDAAIDAARDTLKALDS